MRVMYSLPVLSPSDLGMDETPCCTCKHPRWRHYDGELTSGTIPDGRCRTDKCTCTKYATKVIREG